MSLEDHDLHWDTYLRLPTLSEGHAMDQILAELKRRTGACAAVFLRLVGGPAQQVWVAAQHHVGDLAPSVARWLGTHRTLNELGWTVAELLPVEQPGARTLQAAGTGWPIAGGMVMSGDRIVGWLAVQAAPRGLPGRRRLLDAWRNAADQICADARPPRARPLEPAVMVVDPVGDELLASDNVRLWAALPGLLDALRAATTRFLGERCPDRRIGLDHGVVQLRRMTGDDGPAAMVRLDPYRPLRRPTLATLSPRQVDVCLLAANGATAPEIAESLGVGEETVRSHIKGAYRRLGVANRFELAQAFEAPWPEQA